MGMDRRPARWDDPGSSGCWTAWTSPVRPGRARGRETRWATSGGGRRRRQETVAYGQLDDSWGDAEILVPGQPDAQRARGPGRSCWPGWRPRGHPARKLNYIYNVVPHVPGSRAGHRVARRAQVRRTTMKRLRKQVRVAVTPD
ncbi:hypothetical protein HBB16_21640 [Pseudonocardia sp. MCCB 268]|nr:hypothetical protein [Pseudonocardia cytotoxica]